MTKTKVPKIYIGLLSTGDVRIETALSLASAVASTEGVYFHILQRTGCYIHLNREEIVLEAQRENATHIMFIDSDMIFPPDGINTLLSRNKEIIGGNYNYRQLPIRTVVKFDPKDIDSDEITLTDDPGNPENQKITIKDPTKPFKCRSAGMGFMLIKMSVFEKIPRPWFFFKPSSDPEGFVGEDVWFCDRAKEAGFKVWCDPSIHISHIGIGIY
jgi:GT2 family glycosyltransferase